jgi:hydrogenase-4 membrane subunit HyfE
MADSELIVNISIITIQSMLMPTRLMKKIDLEKAEYKEENSNTGNLKGVITLFISILLISHQVTTTLHHKSDSHNRQY